MSDKAEILHANAAALRMLDARSPILSLGGRIAALHAEATRELRLAIDLARSEEARLRGVGIGVPLIEKDMSAATAHILPLGRSGGEVAGPAAAIFVARVEPVIPDDLGILSRIFRFTPAETRLLKEIMSGASLNEAARVLGIGEATAKTHRNHIFMKAGVSRRAELLALIGRLLPPIRRGPQPNG